MDGDEHTDDDFKADIFVDDNTRTGGSTESHDDVKAFSSQGTDSS